MTQSSNRKLSSTSSAWSELYAHRWLLGVLALLMVLSRPYPMSGIVHLADASNAIFFVGGLMLMPALALPLLIALSALLDFVSIKFFGTSAFCVSAAYGFLWVAYALLWFGGRALASSLRPSGQALKVLLGFALLQVVAHELTSTSFYFLSGRFFEPSWTGSLARSARYLPGYLLSGFWYVAVFVGLHLGLQRSLETSQRLRGQ